MAVMPADSHQTKAENLMPKGRQQQLLKCPRHVKVKVIRVQKRQSVVRARDVDHEHAVALSQLLDELLQRLHVEREIQLELVEVATVVDWAEAA